jgi:hypothetical protein
VWGRGLVEEDLGPVELLHEGEQGALLTVPAAHSHHCAFINVVDPDHFAADPGPTFHFDVDLTLLGFQYMLSCLFPFLSAPPSSDAFQTTSFRFTKAKVPSSDCFPSLVQSRGVYTQHKIYNQWPFRRQF